MIGAADQSFEYLIYIWKVVWKKELREKSTTFLLIQKWFKCYISLLVCRGGSLTMNR